MVMMKMVIKLKVLKWYKGLWYYMRILRIIRTWFCNHDYGDGKPCPFKTSDDCSCAVFVCNKCGKQKLVEFRR